MNSNVSSGFYAQLREKLEQFMKTKSSQPVQSLVDLECTNNCDSQEVEEEDNQTFSTAYTSLSVSRNSIVETSVLSSVQELNTKGPTETDNRVQPSKLLEAKGLLELNDFKACEEVLTEILKDGPENYDLAIMLVDCFYRQGELSRSISACAAILKAMPTHQLAKERQERAQTVLEALLNSQKFYAKKKYRKAIAETNKALEIDGKNSIVTAVILNNRAMALKKLSYFRSALEDFNESYELNPTNKKVYEKRAICFYKLRKFAECINDCEEAIKVRSSRGIKKLLRKSVEAQIWHKEVESRNRSFFFARRVPI